MYIQYSTSQLHAQKFMGLLCSTHGVIKLYYGAVVSLFIIIRYHDHTKKYSGHAYKLLTTSLKFDLYGPPHHVSPKYGILLQDKYTVAFTFCRTLPPLCGGPTVDQFSSEPNQHSICLAMYYIAIQIIAIDQLWI